MSIYIHLIIASLFWGLNVIVMKLLLKHIPFLLLAFLRVVLSFICLYIYMRFKKIKIERIEFKKILLISIFGIYLNFLFTFYGMQHVKGVDNAFINALSPVITLVISYFLLGHKLIKKEIFAVLVSFLAFLLSIHFQIFSLKLGFYLMVLGVFCYMISNVLLQKWDIKNSIHYTFYQLGIGAILLFVHTLLAGKFRIFDINLSIYYWLLFIVISGIGFAYIQIIYMKASKRIGALKTSFFLSLNPIVTYVASVFILDEELDYLHLLSFGLLMIAVIIVKGKN